MSTEGRCARCSLPKDVKPKTLQPERLASRPRDAVHTLRGGEPGAVRAESQRHRGIVMRMRIVVVIVAAVALAACGGDGQQAGGSAAPAGQAVDSGPAPTPALDSVGGGEREQGRQD